jgi:hypothetical protein
VESASGLLEWPVDSFGLALDLGVLALVTTVLVIIARRLYPPSHLEVFDRDREASLSAAMKSCRWRFSARLTKSGGIRRRSFTMPATNMKK